jgi:hypothetical protein
VQSVAWCSTSSSLLVLMIKKKMMMMMMMMTLWLQQIALTMTRRVTRQMEQKSE